MAKLGPALWRDIMGFLRQNHPTICRRWFEDLNPIDLKAGTLRIRTKNAVQKGYLQQHCKEHFTEAAQAVTGALVAVQFVEGPAHVHDALATASSAQNGEQATASVSRRSPAALEGQRLGEVVLSPDYCFDGFVTGPGNQLAHAAAVAVSEQPGNEYNPLFIHGPVGLGKTHLLQAICQQLLQGAADLQICFLSCDAFVNQYLEAVQKSRMNLFRKYYRMVDVLVIDDIHFLANRERSQEEFFHTFNALYQANHQIVLSSDSPPDEIPQLEERLKSRFQGGFVASISKPTYETRVAILRSKAELRQLELSDDVICYIAAKIDSNARELEGALNTVQGCASLQGRKIDLELAKESLGESTQGPRKSQTTLQQIIDLVTEYYHIKLSDLQSKRRLKSIAVPRQISMYLARRRTRFSLEQIGGYFGGRDHTTVMHAVKVVEQRIAANPEFARDVEHIEQELRNGHPLTQSP
jgi:chromosomal replication initiator protein